MNDHGHTLGDVEVDDSAHSGLWQMRYTSRARAREPRGEDAGCGQNTRSLQYSTLSASVTATGKLNARLGRQSCDPTRFNFEIEAQTGRVTDGEESLDCIVVRQHAPA